MTRLRLSVIALTLLISSNAWADLKTYDVDPQYQEEIFSALRAVLEPQGLLPQGRVQMLPSGQILVNASPETLEQIEQVLQAIRARPAPAAPRASLRYWTVLGTRGQGNAEAVVGSPPPAMLNDVLAELRRLHQCDRCDGATSELTFRVLGTAAVATNSGQFGAAHGWPLSVQQTAHIQGDTLNAEISMELTGMAPNTIGNSQIGNVVVRTTLKRGEFVVLGESQVQFPAGDGGGGGGPVFYIVHWEE